MKWFALVITLMLLAFNLAPAAADSLWQPNTESAFIDTKAHRVGDLVTILVAESSASKHAAATDSKKSLELEAKAGTGFLKFIKPFSLAADRTAAGSGNSAQATSLVDRVTVKVVEVLPNGTLKLQGERDVCINADKLKLTLTGTVRKEDISADNTIVSSQIADLCITSSGKGPIADTQKPGIIYQILRWLW